MFNRSLLSLWIGIILLSSVFLMGQDATWGPEECHTLLNIEFIDPIYFVESTHQVDVVQSDCGGTPERYDDHLAEVTFSNRPFPEGCSGETIYLTEYRVWYEPLTQGAPALDGFTRLIAGEPGIPPCELGANCSGITITAEFVPIIIKSALRDYLQASGVNQVKYDVQYTFFGENDLGHNISAVGTSFFYAANYDNCEY